VEYGFITGGVLSNGRCQSVCWRRHLFSDDNRFPINTCLRCRRTGKL